MAGNQASGQGKNEQGAALVDKSHKRHVANTNPNGVYSGTAVRNAIEDGRFFPNGDWLDGAEPLKGKKKKK